ncbi:MAG: DUF4294 domain-containing protein [Flavobacteriales bacterium]|nr:DUF4294 domain-containing protein [Flavobacteriales bacterium]
MAHTGRIVFSCLMALSVLRCLAQTEGDFRVLRAMVHEGDTVPVVDLGSAWVTAQWSPKARKEQVQYTRLMRQVVKVYPYARLTSDLLSAYEADLRRIEKEHDRDLYMKLAEAELRAEFEDELKDLTMGQGRVLVKLIDRETGSTSFELVKQLRGSFNAFIWQSLAVLFGQDLKSRYDPLGDDRMIEHIVQRIEAGELAVAERPARSAKAQARLEKRKTRLYKRYGLTAANYLEP